MDNQEQRSSDSVIASKEQPSAENSSKDTENTASWLIFDDGGSPGICKDYTSLAVKACDVEVINATLRVVSKIATKGVGEKEPAKGFLIILGDGGQLMEEGNEFGKPPRPELNPFIGKELTIYDVESSGAAQRYAYPTFITDGAIVINGRDGEILASNYTITCLQNHPGSTAGGKKHEAASSIAQAGFFVIKCSEDSCSIDGRAHGQFGMVVRGGSRVFA